MNVGTWVTRWASLRPHKAALIHEEEVLTYLKLNERINRLANLRFFFRGPALRCPR